LNYIKEKKNKNKLKHLFIYTNNRCLDRDWIKNITVYFDYKLETQNLFDKAVCAFKIDNQIIDINKKHEKNINYFINCTIIPKNTEICFIDNTYYNEMLNQQVYYIQPVSYNHNMNKNDVINRFMNSYVGNFIISKSNVRTNYKHFLIDWFNITNVYFNRPKKKISYSDCIETTKKILFHIQEFFNIYNMNPKTRKKLKSIGNFTRKQKQKQKQLLY
jgi:hypothetical protein